MRHLMTIISAGATALGIAGLAAGAAGSPAASSPIGTLDHGTVVVRPAATDYESYSFPATAERAGVNGAIRIYRGNPVPLGHGTARAYVVWEDESPVELGVALSKTALSGLPGGDGTAAHQHGVSFFEHLLELPENSPPPYRFIELDWNPGGHEPPGVYDRPHFDFHFYTVDLATRNAITPENPEFEAKGLRQPAAEYVPAGYLAPAPLVVPRMGLHWLDAKTPELNGQPFTTTFIYGSWDGRLIFAEPMITKAFIESTADTTIAVPMASTVHVAGYYPSSYRVRFDEASQEYRIALSGFERRAGGTP